ncbi:MAG: hypothetical protein QOI55_268, partial [Actinomycetota bacterium]|nr:hypothetical protein [Actinomycetota bacterium]
LRILAASAVVVSHGYALLGRHEPHVLSWHGEAVTLGRLGVDVFFVASGFLVSSSWAASSNLRVFAVRRGARILPGLVVVVLLTAFVLGPLVTSLSPGAYFSSAMPWKYAIGNSLVFPIQYFLPGVFPHDPSVNGSLWTLRLEVLAYVGLAALGALRLFQRRFTWPVVFVGLGVASWLVALHPDAVPKTVATLPVFDLLSLFTMFAGGALLWNVGDRVPARAWLAVVAVAALLATRGLPLLGVQFVALPYLVWYFGTQQWRFAAWLRRFGDPSYGIYIYASPITHLLVRAYDGHVSPPLLVAEAIAVSAVAGYLSFHLVEKPAMRAARRLVPGSRPEPVVSLDEHAVEGDAVGDAERVPGDVTLADVPGVRAGSREPVQQVVETICREQP